MYQNILSTERKGFKIVHSIDGYDEVSLTDKFKVFSKEGEAVIYPDEINQATVQESDHFMEEIHWMNQWIYSGIFSVV